jgi:hypothetical protein
MDPWAPDFRLARTLEGPALLAFYAALLRLVGDYRLEALRETILARLGRAA